MMSHAADYAWAPLIAAISGRAASFLPEDFFEGLISIDGERTFEAQAWYPPYDLKTRNVTTWLSEKLTVGGMSYDQTQLGGAAGDANSFTPGVVQWAAGDEVGFLTVSWLDPLKMAQGVLTDWTANSCAQRRKASSQPSPLTNST